MTKALNAFYKRFFIIYLFFRKDHIAKYSQLFRLIIFSLCLLINTAIKAATITSNTGVTGFWDVAGTWVGGVVPGPGDDVIIEASATITVRTNVSCLSLSWTGNPTATRTFTINAGSTLTVSGNITLGTTTTNGRNRIFNVLGTLDCDGSFTMQASGGDTRDIELDIGTNGIVNITGNLIMASAFLRHHVDLIGNAQINIGGNIGANATGTTTGGGFTDPPAGSIINLNGTLPQNFFTQNAPVYSGTFKINNAAGVILRRTLALGTSTLTIGDITANSVLKDSGNSITSTGTFNLQNGSTFILGRYSGTTGTATTYPAFSTNNIDLGTTVEYAHINANQNVSTTPQYANLVFSSSVARSRVILAGTLTIRGDLNIGANTTFLGSTNNPTTNLGGDFVNSGTFTSGTGLFTMDGTNNQSITGTALFVGGLTINNTGGGGSNIVTLNNSITTTGNLTLTNGILDLGAFTANRTAAGGTMTISNGTRLIIGGTNSLPTNYNTHIIGATSTIEYDGTTNVVTAPNGGVAYGNLEIDATGAATSASFSVVGVLSVLTGRSLIASAGIVTMSAATSSIVNDGTLTFDGLTIAATPNGQSQYNTSYNVSGVLTVAFSVTFAPTGGTITMNDPASSISNAGTLTFNNLTISATPTAQSQYNTSFDVAGTFATNGAITFAPTGGTITMSGVSGIISNPSGTLTFNSLIIDGTIISSTGNFGVANTMTVNSTFAPAAASIITGAGTLVGTGTVRVTRTAAVPSFGAQYTIANKTLTDLTVNYIGAGAQTVDAQNYGNLTISTNGTRTVTFENGGTIRVSGVFTPTATTTSYVVTGNNFDYNGSGAQTIAAFTYNNLIISNAGAKTVLAGTIVNCLTITLNDAAVLTLPDTATFNVTQ